MKTAAIIVATGLALAALVFFGRMAVGFQGFSVGCPL